MAWIDYLMTMLGFSQQFFYKINDGFRLLMTMIVMDDNEIYP